MIVPRANRKDASTRVTTSDRVDKPSNMRLDLFTSMDHVITSACELCHTYLEAICNTLDEEEGSSVGHHPRPTDHHRVSRDMIPNDAEQVVQLVLRTLH